MFCNSNYKITTDSVISMNSDNGFLYSKYNQTYLYNSNLWSCEVFRYGIFWLFLSYIEIKPTYNRRYATSL